MTLFLFLLGILLLVGGADLLVRGAARIALAAGITPLVIGLTVVAFGTSAPELAVTTSAALAGEPDLAMGNVVGSNIFNVLLILGASALVAPLVVSRKLVRFEVPLLTVSSLMVLLMALDGRVSNIEGLVLLAGAFGYTGLLLRNSRKAAPEVRGAMQSADAGEASDRAVAAPTVDGVHGGDAATGAAGSGGTGYPLADAMPERTAGAGGRGGLLRDLLMVAGGLALLVLGARWLVEGARVFASALGVSELVIGLTVVAAGTSLPELATSVVAAVRGERDIAVGNIVGSNLFNVLLILGTAALVSPGGVPASEAAVRFDIPVMVGVSIACMPIFFSGLRIARWEGALFLGYYVAYTAWIVLSATGHEALDTYRDAMLFFVLPLTAITLAVLMASAVRRRTDAR